MKRYPIVFSIAPSYCKGGAGIQADIKTISALGAYAATAVTAIIDKTYTLESTSFVIPNDIIEHQIESVMEGIWPDVVKIGQITDVETAKIIANCLRKYHPEYVVYDPILKTVTNQQIVDDDSIRAINNELFPFTNLVILNFYEAEIMTGIKINDKEKLREVAKKLSEKYQIPFFLKGSDIGEEEQTYDVLYIPDGENWEYIAPKLGNVSLFGASATFSTAIASYLALGYELNIAVMKSREFLTEAIQRGKDIIIGHGSIHPICHTWNPVKMQVYGQPIN